MGRAIVNLAIVLCDESARYGGFITIAVGPVPDVVIPTVDIGAGEPMNVS
jgi:hypothetical protein